MELGQKVSELSFFVELGPQSRYNNLFSIQDYSRLNPRDTSLEFPALAPVHFLYNDKCLDTQVSGRTVLLKRRLAKQRWTTSLGSTVPTFRDLSAGECFLDEVNAVCGQTGLGGKRR